MSARANAETPAATALIVFGRDNGGKPHASRFDANEAELAEKAAGLMGMQVLRPETGEQRALAAKLPRGRVFASGRAFVPFVKAAVYGPLAAFGRPAEGEGAGEPESGCTASAGAPEGHSESGEPGDPVNPNGGNGRPPAPATWAEIEVGSLVLAAEGPGEPWYEAVVVKAAGDVLTLKWRDYPDHPQFVRRRHKLALLHPTGKAA